MKKVLAAVGAVSGVITIWQFLEGLVKSTDVIVTPLMLLCAGITAVCILASILISHKRARYAIYKWISFVFRRPNLQYYLKQKEILYTYKDLHNLRYQVITHLVAKSDGFSSYTGKFRWSKPQPLEEFHVFCQSKHHSVTLGRDTTWNTYTVDFDPAPKGNERTVDILVDNLEDPEHKALPFCTSSIVEHTEKLKMSVQLEGGLKFKLDEVRFLVYDNGASVFPILEVAYDPQKRKNLITYDPEQMRITVEECHPVYGYKYQLSWEFQ